MVLFAIVDVLELLLDVVAKRPQKVFFEVVDRKLQPHLSLFVALRSHKLIHQPQRGIA